MNLEVLEKGNNLKSEIEALNRVINNLNACKKGYIVSGQLVNHVVGGGDNIAIPVSVDFIERFNKLYLSHLKKELKKKEKEFAELK